MRQTSKPGSEPDLRAFARSATQEPASLQAAADEWAERLFFVPGKSVARVERKMGKSPDG